MYSSRSNFAFRCFAYIIVSHYYFWYVRAWYLRALALATSVKGTYSLRIMRVAIPLKQLFLQLQKLAVARFSDNFILKIFR